MVDERHDRLVAGRRGGGGDPARDPVSRGVTLTPGSRRASASAMAWLRDDRLAGDGRRVAPTEAVGGSSMARRGRGCGSGSAGSRLRRSGSRRPPWASRATARRLDRSRGRRQRRRVDLDLTASWTSDDALRNSRMLLPSAAPTSGSLPGPRMRSAITRMMTSSRGPGVGMVGACSCETRVRGIRPDGVTRALCGRLG